MKKDKRNHLVIVIQAILITVIFHALLLFLFRAPQVEPELQDYGYRRIALLPAGGSGELAPERLHTWLQYHDPTLIAKPNREFGYGRLTAQHGLRHHLPTANPTVPARKPHFAAGTRPAWLKSAEPFTASAAAVADWPVPPLPGVTESSAAVAAVMSRPDAVTVRDQYGDEQFRGAFDTDREAIAAELRQTPPTRRTVILIGPPDGGGRMPRFALRASCGNRRLDELARRVLLGLVMAHRPSGDLTLNITWPEAEVKK